MPSSSSPRGLRVVQEMEYCRSVYSCRSMSISVDFPHPEGALITMKRGFVFMARIVYHTRPRSTTPRLTFVSFHHRTVTR